MVTPKDVVRHELIGLEAEVSASTNNQMVGLKGRITDETRNTITIETASGEKKIAKAECTFLLTLPSGERVNVEGRLLAARPEDRVKKKHKKW